MSFSTLINDIERLRTAGFGTKSFQHSTEIIEECSLQAFLSLSSFSFCVNFMFAVVEDLKVIIKSTEDKLKLCAEKDSMANDLTTLLITMKLMCSHFGFTLEVLETKTEDQMKKVKEKYADLQDRYTKIQRKENLTDLPAKIALATFHDKLLLEVDIVVRKCFKKKHGKFYLNSGGDNLALIKIMVSHGLSIFFREQFFSL